MESVNDYRKAFKDLENKFNIISDERSINTLIHQKNALNERFEMFRQAELERIENEKFLKKIETRKSWINKLKKLLK